MTVCITAFCENNVIVMAADRMITSADIEFEPQVTPPRIPVGKIVPLTSSIALLTAGDAGFQTEAVLQIHRLVNKRIVDEPQNWWSVKEVADLYTDFYNRDRLRRIKNEILSPFGLDSDTFISRQKELSDYLIRSMSDEIRNYDMPSVGTLVAGHDGDNTGHIYRVYGGEAIPVDSIGFAAIGIGARHANSQFMFHGHHRNRSLAETLLLTYVAKKRSEVAPGVGKETDLFMSGIQRGTLARIENQALLNMLEHLYKEITKGETKAFNEAQLEVQKFVDSLGRKQEEGQEPPPTPPSSPSTPDKAA